MIGIPNYQPGSKSNSELVCWSNLNSYELIAVYGIHGQGGLEAAAICEGMDQAGLSIRWNT
jgi:hypothetical protein